MWTANIVLYYPDKKYLIKKFQHKEVYLFLFGSSNRYDQKTIIYAKKKIYMGKEDLYRFKGVKKKFMSESNEFKSAG
jgi:hypothetical protein